jgi:hypothetical protein
MATAAATRTKVSHDAFSCSDPEIDMLKVRSILTFRPVAFLADEGVEQKVSHK